MINYDSWLNSSSDYEEFVGEDEELEDNEYAYGCDWDKENSGST